MGHIATLLGVEPTHLGATRKNTLYESYTGVVAPLASFFTDLGYATHFVSTASLDFLNQREFLKNVGFEHFVETGFDAWKRYTFGAAPDEALYAKTVELVKDQTSPYFVALQTISSHTPYYTPYGTTAEDMYRYVDESFAAFYEQLRKIGFFEDGILLVVSDHRKITPLETEEFEQWGPSAASKIMAFMLGSGIQAKVINDQLYQQTDVFYSLLREFGSGKVEVWKQSNDLFARRGERKWALKHFPVQRKVHVFDQEGKFGYLDLDQMQFVTGKEFFPAEEILNYLQLGLDFQQ